MLGGTRSRFWLILLLAVTGVLPVGVEVHSAAAAPAGFRLPFVGDATWSTNTLTHGGSSSAAIDFVPRATTNAWNRQVIASEAGRVVYKGFQANKSGQTCPWPDEDSQYLAFGYLVILYHPTSGLYSYYAHLLPAFDAGLPAAGSTTTIPKGTPIGTMGNTGCSSNAHLHFEIRSGVNSTNPVGTGSSLNIRDMQGMGSGTTTGSAVGPALSGGDTDDNRTLTSGQTLNGTISPNSDTDTYFFQGTSGQVATLRMNKTGTSTLDSYLSIYKPDGSLMNNPAFDDDRGGNNNALADPVLTVTGQYRVVAQSYNGGSGGAYSLSLTLGSANVSCSSQQYTASYFNNTTLSGSPAFQRCEGWPINFDWGSGSPGAGVGSDNFSVRWTGQASLAAGTYNFIVRSDDVIRVWIDNVLIINTQAYEGYQVQRSMTAGTHTIKVEMVEYSGLAYAAFRWEATSSSIPAPTNVRSTITGPTSFTVYWDYNFAQFVTGFRVFLGNQLITTTGASARSLGVTGLGAGTYLVRVKAVNGSQESPFSADHWVTLVGQSCPAEPQANQVFLYEHPNYSGRCEIFTASDPDLSNNVIGNDTVSAIKVGSGVSATLFHHTYYGTPSFTFTAHDPDMNGVVGHDVTSSIQITARTTGCSADQYTATYFNNETLSGSPALTRCEAWPINYDWGYGGPGGGVNPDHFSIRWVGRPYLTAGTYQITAWTDDGMRVWIGGVIVLNEWRHQGPTQYVRTFTVSTSGYYDLKVEYYEIDGYAMAKFRYDRVAGASGVSEPDEDQKTRPDAETEPQSSEPTPTP